MYGMLTMPKSPCPRPVSWRVARGNDGGEPCQRGRQALVPETAAVLLGPGAVLGKYLGFLVVVVVHEHQFEETVARGALRCPAEAVATLRTEGDDGEGRGDVCFFLHVVLSLYLLGESNPHQRFRKPLFYPLN